MKNEFKDGALTFYLEGKIDSSNAEEVERELLDELSLFDNIDIAFDASSLMYISSAGLRILLKIKKQLKKDIRVTHVSDELFDIFDVTGFTDILTIEREMRRISLQCCKKISSALNGEIFQLSDDEMIKVFSKETPLSEIKKERQYAQTAMIIGVPTLIPYDVVQCEYGYGIVYEKSEMTSLAYMISHNTDSLEIYAHKLGVMMKELHSTEVIGNKLPDIKDRYKTWLREVGDTSDAKVSVFSSLISSIPDSPTYVNGDINLNSVMVKGNELLLIDMSGSAHGNSLFDLQALFASLVGIESKHEGYCLKTYGLSKISCIKFWNKFFSTYMSGRQQEIDSMNQLLSKYFILKENVLNKVEQKHRLKK
ncbi:MAG: STAS domain-containing protein [Lachnospiraceae bacterium]|nr:STAS domain-containing protein [Lachnospiraceae bacterium]